MKLWIQALALVTLCGCKSELASIHPNPPFEIPELIPVGGIPDSYEWKFKDGPDFYTYLAEKGETGVSIYFGTHPHFEEKNRKKKDSTTLLSTRIDWLESDLDSHSVIWEALVPYRHSPHFTELKLHLWIWGSSEEQVRDLAIGLENMSFDQTTYEKRRVNQTDHTTPVSAPR
ncbi:hypothetical protein [Pelagicoccus albus]|uniref:Uncharacterized protein n=1 Tax=Pelagicoccus albus TaxID=415222 RepID=A0A7X1B653_9BACT|nr:hypothetical protein [Pelagicoccus albus]MBC2604809.1 hypothetical protein [Pelagicoccus albus]MBC2606312.1 hypothetical protein [Pelagicoccus albus]